MEDQDYKAGKEFFNDFIETINRLDTSSPPIKIDEMKKDELERGVLIFKEMMDKGYWRDPSRDKSEKK